MDGVGMPVGDEAPALAKQRGADFCAAVPDGRFGAPSDIAGTVVFLCSGVGRYVNGQTLRVDGGMSAANRLW
jgi:NAD(P)-dependent dehydrogenase (short-subunit alcohol dehydrogenase family)